MALRMNLAPVRMKAMDTMSCLSLLNISPRMCANFELVDIELTSRA